MTWKPTLQPNFFVLQWAYLHLIISTISTMMMLTSSFDVQSQECACLSLLCRLLLELLTKHPKELHPLQEECRHTLHKYSYFFSLSDKTPIALKPFIIHDWLLLFNPSKDLCLSFSNLTFSYVNSPAFSLSIPSFPIPRNALFPRLTSYACWALLLHLNYWFHPLITRGSPC